MAKDFAKSFYNGPGWDAVRQAYIDERIQIDGGLCERCQTEQGYIVHHKVWLTPQNINDPSITLNPENFEYLCKDCHYDEHYEQLNGKKRAKVKCLFSDDGQPLPPFKV